MDNKKRIFSISMAVFLMMMLVVAIVAGCAKPAPAPTPTPPPAPPPAPEVKHIKIGTIMPHTGPLSILGLAFTRGWGFYADKLQEQGGIKIGDDRYVFDFINEDSKLSPEAAGIAATKLVTQDKVKYVIGAILESEVEAIYQITAPAKVLYVMGNINIPGHPADVGPDKPLLVRLVIDHDDTHAADLDYLVKTYPAAKNIAIVAPNIGYEGMIENLQGQAAGRGLNVSLVEKWEWGTTDFIPTYTRVLAFKPDAIFAMVSGQAQYQLMAARQLGFKGPFISNSPLGADVFVNVVGDPAALTDVICNSPDIYHPTDAVKDLLLKWEQKYGAEPFVSDCIHPYDMPWILAQGMEEAQSIDPERVMATLETMTAPGSLMTNFGPGRMGGMKKHGVNRVLSRPIPITRIMNGKTEFIGLIPPVE